MAVRWRIFWLLLALTIIAYIERTSVSVAGAKMMPDLQLSQVQLGWLETAFLVSYTALQFPGAVAGGRLGARRMITLCGLLGVAAVLAMPAAPAFLSGAPLFVALLAAQFVLGMSQAPFFAMVSGALERWFPARDWAMAQGVNSCGIGLGAAAAPAIIASLMVALGWRAALVITALPVLGLVVWWWIEARDGPHLHPAVTPAELDHIGRRAEERPANWRDAMRLIAHPSLAGLTFSYLLMNIAFYLIAYWSFLYLVQARGLSLLAGGFAAAAPPLAGAVGAGVGGLAVGACAARWGAKRGLRIIPLITLPLAGLLLWAAVRLDLAWLALAALSASFGFLEMNESAFWTASMRIGRRDAPAAGGLLNTGGNLGGIIATPAVAYLSSHGGWNLPFEVGATCAALSGLAWLFIDPATPARSLEARSC